MPENRMNWFHIVHEYEKVKVETCLANEGQACYIEPLKTVLLKRHDKNMTGYCR